MIVILKSGVSREQVSDFSDILRKKYGVDVHTSFGEQSTVLGLVGDTKAVDIDSVSAFPIVETVRRVQEPYKKVNRKFHPDDTVIDVAGHKIGNGELQIMAGPCSVESEEQITGIAESVKKSGANFLRGGAFKPRTSPYAFQGLGADGLMIEVHNDPPHALSDGAQSITPEQFQKLCDKLFAVTNAIRSITHN